MPLPDVLIAVPDPRPTANILRGSDLRPEPVDWLWDGYLARGKLHMCAGAPGTGKTTLALALASTVSSGGYWPDGTRSEAGNALIWSGEDDVRDTLVPRLLAMGADMGRIHFINGTYVDGVHRPFDPSTDMEALSLECLRIKDIKLMIVDPVVSAVAGDSHKNSEVRRGLQPLVDLAMTLKAAVLGISHFSKGTAGRDPLERVTGSVAFGALPRVVFGCAKVSDEAGEEKRIFVRSKSNIGPDGGGFEYGLIQSELPGYTGMTASSVVWSKPLEGSAQELLRIETDTGDRTERADAKDWLCDVLANGPLSAKVIKQQAGEAGLSWATIRRAQQDLQIRPTKTRFDGGWEWSLPPKVLKKDEDAHLKRVSTLGKNEHLGRDDGAPVDTDRALANQEAEAERIAIQVESHGR